MKRALIGAALLVGVALAQSPESKSNFEAADVHVSPHSDTNFNLFMRGPQTRAGRYEIRTGTMVDLVSTAYGVDTDKVFGGPTWLELDRYDVTAKVPAGSTPESQRTMLQALLADRFRLVAHQDIRPLPAYLLTAGKHPQLKESDAPSGPKGCQGKPRPQHVEPGTVIQNEVECHGLTMADFASQVQNMAGAYLPQTVIDKTGLTGTYDFDLTWTGRGQLPLAGAEGISIFDAVDKELGLKLELQTTPQPVVVVDSVNQKPTANAPEIGKILPGAEPPTQFEVADVKPTPSDYQGIRFQILPGGQMNLQGVNLMLLFQQVWGFSEDMIVGAPKWLSEDRFDIIAKAPAASLVNGGQNGPPIDIDSIFAMVKNLLAERFHLQAHMEERPVNAYTLVATKPKLKPADPTGRIRCNEGPALGGKDPRDTHPILGRLLTCQNMTMDRFASMLQSLASGYIHAPVLNSTELDGSWDFTLSFSTAGQLQGGGGGGGGGTRAPGGAPAASSADASDPNGAISLMDALQKQLGLKLEQSKRPVQVLVIDHIEQKPTDN